MSDLRVRNLANKSKHDVLNKEDNLTDYNSKSLQNQVLSPRVLARVVVIFLLLIIVYVSSKKQKETLTTFAKQSEQLPGKGQTVECSPNYMTEVNKYEGCFPRQCGRFITDNIVSQKEADELLNVAMKGFQMGGSSGGASILDLHSGALSKGHQFVNIYKIEEAKNIFTANDFNFYRVVKEKIKYAIAHHFSVYPDKIYLTHPTFFSRLTSEKPATVHDEYWHPHIDKETYKSFHYTTLLYLNNYNLDFKGGRFVFIDENVNKTIEPRKTRLSMFTSGAENKHFVERVTEGVRYAVTISFTCDKLFAIDDPNVDKYSQN